MIYYIIFCALAFIALMFDILPYRLQKKLELPLFMAVAFYFILFAGLRTTGLENDYTVYKSVFNRIASSTTGNYDGYRVEYGYMLFNKLCSGLGFNGFIFVLAAVSIVLKLTLFYRICSKKFIALFYYYCLTLLQSDMGLLRHSLAAGICYCALEYLIGGHKSKFIFVILLASMFHISSLSMLAILILGDRFYKTRIYVIFLIMCFMMSFARSASKIILTLSHVINVNNTFAIRKMTNYIDMINSVSGGSMGITPAIFISLCRRILLFSAFTYIAKIKLYKNSKDRSRTYVYYNCFYVSILIPILFSELSGLASHRGSLTFKVSEIFMFSELCGNIGKNSTSFKEYLLLRFASAVIVFALGFYTMRSTLYFYNGFIPYTWSIGI